MQTAAIVVLLGLEGEGGGNPLACSMWQLVRSVAVAVQVAGCVYFLCLGTV